MDGLALHETTGDGLTVTELLQTRVPDCDNMINVKVKLCEPALTETDCWPFCPLIAAPLFTAHTHVSPEEGALSAVKLFVLPMHTVRFGIVGQLPAPALTLTEQFEVAEQPVVLLVTVTVKLTVPPASDAPEIGRASCRERV